MTNEVEIRDYQSADYPQIIELWSQTGLGGAQRGDNQQIIEQSIAMGGRLLVAVLGNELVGTSWMTFDGRRIHLHHFGILPKYQRKGIGKNLTEKSIQFAKEKGYQVKLEVHKDNTNAIALYTKMGFSYLGDYDVYIIRDFKNL
ncbi:MAG TPA: GNAT family N-acetyltransferase [Tenuifilaceae bacterium]|nr:GNAT family N-acetyltransferase [Tenuifilaceae bacterium]HPE19254.1 GNAT family N-acetyltransferase [Tenuifilaceae bacterium]HPJ47184.1 GNAT family N-acetyltransferase [Tenuifilaceae bacterium]HPQ35816.1 GNAT family N-acetyltransferase [Tenuifilaceae bacterium]HRX69443.1 GNAT family N-acetyltransferase [Tenuifilaceae bacterium]